MIRLAAAVANRDVFGVEKEASALMLWFGDIGPEAQKEMNRRYEIVGEEEEIGKWVFRIFFLLGSCVLAVTWWKTNIGVGESVS